jgi:2,3-bisphosphoglycerate-independent phosphoglycerate mutase
MKGVLVIIDGMGDLPNKQLSEKTPLEAADTPNLDFLATRGEMGYMYPVRPGFIPESDEAIVSMFGNELVSSSRGQLEVRGTNIKLTRGDLALRVNFATISSLEKGEVIDRRAGRTLTTAEAEGLAKAIRKIKLPCEFVFQPTVQHRGVLVLRGGFSDNISGNDMTYVEGKNKSDEKVLVSKPFDEEENTYYTTNILNDFLEKVYEVLNTHPINVERKRKGLMPANYLLVRGAGIEPPKLKQYKKWVSPSSMPLEIGFSRASGMKTFHLEQPKLKKLDVYANLYESMARAVKFSIRTLKKHKKTSDYAYVHIKETDLPGHDNKPFEKKEMIEYLDKTLFSFLKKFAPANKIKVVVTADHSTPCKLKAHSADPVPVLLYDDSPPQAKRFGETEARKGKLGKILGKDLLKKVGFSK